MIEYNKIDSIDWTVYKNKRVMIKGCTSSPVPTWSYLIITAQLSGYAKEILYDVFNQHGIKNYERVISESIFIGLKNTIRKGDKILFKGSRGMAMETVIQGVFE